MVAIHLLLVEVRPTTLDSDANICVVKMATIEFKELNQKDSKIVFEGPAIFLWMMLTKHKEKSSDSIII